MEEPHPNPGLVGAWGEFRRAALRPSLPALLGTLLVTVLLFVVGAVAITPQFLTSLDHRYVMARDWDEYARLTVTGLRLRTAAPQTPAVALLGASGMREAISDSQQIERVILTRLGQPVPVYDLMAGGLNNWLVTAMADCLGEGFDGAVVISVSPARLARGENLLDRLLENRRLGLDSPALDEEVRLAGRKVPRRSGIYFLDHFRFCAARRGSLLRLVTGPAKPKRHLFLDKPPETGKAWESKVERQRRRLEPYYDHRETSLAVIGRIVDRLRRRGRVEIVLLEASRNPLLVGTVYPLELMADHRLRLERFAREHGVHYWDLQAEAGLVEDDFFDYGHLQKPEAMERYTQVLAKRLATLLAPFVATEESR